MKNICSSCHSNAWIDDFYDGFDKAVEAYNEIYFKPAKAKLDELYEKGLLDKTKFFDELSKSKTMSSGTTKAAGPAWAP